MSITLFPAAPYEDILRRICGEYAEMPGLRVTRQQAQRLWGLESDVCVAALDHLIAVGFLCKTRDDQYSRLTDGPTILPLRMAKAELRQNASRRIAAV